MQRIIVSVLCSGLLAACHSGSPESSTATPDAAPSTASTFQFDASFAHHRDRDASAEIKLDPLCAIVLAEEKLDVKAMDDQDRTSPGARIRCWSTGPTAWALRVDRVGTSAQMKQTILYATTAGARARSTSTVDDVEWPPVLGRHAVMYDFDGDGVPELFTVVPKNLKTFVPASRVFVTYKSGAISSYPTGGSYLVDSVGDLDRDGRPDLRISFDLGKRTVCEASDEGILTVDLAAHSLPGGKFSIDDAAAKAFAERRCPAMPAADQLFIPSGDPAASDKRDLSLAYVACERLRGKSSEAVVAELQAACAPNTDATKKCSGPCRHLPDAITVAKFKPPFQLTAPDAGPK